MLERARVRERVGVGVEGGCWRGRGWGRGWVLRVGVEGYVRMRGEGGGEGDGGEDEG